MNLVLLLTSCLVSVATLGQSNCAIGLVENSNTIRYNKTAIENLIGLAHYDAYFFGESHNSHFEPEFKYEFIKHLHQEYAVKEVFMEIGQSAAHLFNKYLQTGDSTILREYELIYLKGYYPQFWKRLYELNEHLPIQAKLHINGVDFERRELFHLLEKSLRPNVLIPIYLKQTFADIHSVVKNKELTFSDSEFKQHINALRRAFKQYEGDFRKLYPADFAVLHSALTNKTPFTSAVKPRNRAWYKTMRETIKARNIQKMVCFFGVSHTTYSHPTALPVKLRQGDFFTGAIVNITSLYHHYTVARVEHTIFDYNYKEKDFFDQYYDPACRAVIVKAGLLTNKSFKTNSDFVLLAKDVNE